MLDLFAHEQDGSRLHPVAHIIKVPPVDLLVDRPVHHTVAAATRMLLRPVDNSEVEMIQP